MKKIFTLILMAFVAVGAYAQDGIKTVLIGETTPNWEDNIKLPAGTLKGITSSDYLYFTTNASSVKLQYWDGSTNQSIESATNPYPVSEAMATALQSNDLYVQADGNYYKIYYIGYGPSLTFGSATDLSFVSSSQDIDFSPVASSLQMYDKIELTVKSISGTPREISIKDNQSWGTWAEFGGIGSSEKTLMYQIDQRTLNYAKNNQLYIDCKDNGFNDLTITIKYYPCTTANTIVLEPKLKSYIQLASIPSNATVKYNRTFSEGWNSICLPFDADVTAIDASATAYEFTAGSSANITVTSITGTTMNAGVPYLVYVDKKGGVTSATFSNVTVTATTPLSVGPLGGLTLHGNYDAGFSMSGKYGVAYSQTNERWEIMTGTANSKLPAFCAYFDGTPIGGSRGIGIEIGDGTTNINAFEVEEVEEAGPIYNLMGQQTTTPRKGIYIKNGKKYIAK